MSIFINYSLHMSYSSIPNMRPECYTCDGTDKGCSRSPESRRRFCSSGRHRIPPHAGEHPSSWLPSRTTGRASISLKDAEVTSRFRIVELMQQNRSRWGRRKNYSAFKEQKPFKFQKIRVPLRLADFMI
jgi:hypothetical protein